MNNFVKSISETEIDLIIKKPTVSLVQFWAPWCGPCKMMNPILAEVAEDLDSTALKEKISLHRINVDDNKTVAPKYGIIGVPSIVLFRNGEAIATKTGAISKSNLMSFIKGNVK